jgi:hypothetical protein
MQKYEIHSYTKDTLRRLLAERAHTDLHTIDAKRHSVYFEEYFDYLNAQTIVVEPDYTDRDFLEDFAGYYIRCFKDYPRRCTRLHFFSEPFEEESFSSLLSAKATPLTPEVLQKGYLGFIVVKPLPLTIIGRTCLRTYPEEARRYYPITRTYEANLFGLELTIQTLAYQEQDSVAAACATSALWSAFHGTGKQFQHHIPSPVEITKAATSHSPLDTRTFPNSGGLNSIQMADAIRSVGLEPYMMNANDEWVLRSALYAYLRGQIPVLMGVELYDPEPTPPLHVGLHAITVAGYSLSKANPIVYPKSNFALKAFRMDKIYAHDDQVGPFARMEFLEEARFSTYWLNQQKTGHLNVRAEFLLIPLYHKIRIPFQTIFGIVSSFSSLIEEMQQHGLFALPAQLEWDIFLTNVNTLKTEIHGLATLTGEYRLRILTTSMPRFIWRATALVNDNPALDLLFDATDIEQGPSFVGVILYDTALGQILGQIAQALVQANRIYNRPDRHVIDWLANPTFRP